MSHDRGDCRNDRRDNHHRGGNDCGDRFRDEWNCRPPQREVIIIDDGYGRGGRGGGHCNDRFGGIGPIRPIAPIGGCFPERGGFRPPVLLPPVMIEPRMGGYYDGGYQQVPYQRSGGEFYQRGPVYSSDDVYGGRDGYRSSRQRYDGGYQYGSQPQPYYYEQQPRYDYRPSYPVYSQQGPRYSNDDVSGGRDGYRASRQRYDGGGTGYNTGGYDNGMGQAGQVFDFALRGFDAWAGYDVARRYSKR
jgi:hypothetical protein